MRPEISRINGHRQLLLAALASSLVLHGVAFASLGARHAARGVAQLPLTLNFEVEPLPTTRAPEPEPPLPKAAVPSAPIQRALHTAQAVAPPAPTPRPTAAAPNAAAPLDLSGVTLTNDSGGFAMPIGNGAGLTGPIGNGAAAARPEASAAHARPVSDGPRVVPASDLSEHPKPPALADALQRNYPEEARERGLRGSARVRAQIDADGVIRKLSLASESSAGFGAACLRSIDHSRWTPPRAQNGDAVATEIVYTCHFEVDR